MRRRARLSVVLAATIAVAMLASGADAGASFRVTEAQARFPDRAFVLSLPTQAKLGPSRVEVRENGELVPDLRVNAVGRGSGKQFGVVLLIDASDSMRGKAITRAMQAARIFAAQRSTHEQLAVVTFNARPRVVQGFTDDGNLVDAALGPAPQLAYGTHIYDGIRVALRLIKQAGINAGSVVLLSDGADTGSRSSEAAVTKIARHAHVRVFTVGLKSRFFDARALRNLARDTGARFSVATSSAELVGIYQTLGSQLAREYLIHYRSTAGPGIHVAITVRVQGFGAPAFTGYVTPRLSSGAGPRGPYHESFLQRLWRSPLTMILIALLVAALVAGAVVAIASGTRRGTFRKRMAQFVSMPVPEDDERPSAAVAERVEEETERLFGRMRWWGRFSAQLELAGISASPQRIVLFTFIGTFVSVWLLSILTGSVVVALLGLAVPFLVRGAIARKVERKRRLFGEQLPDNLQVMGSALRAGHSFIGALAVVVEDAPEPSRAELRRVLADDQLGVPIEDSLHVVADRMDSIELEQVALVSALQRRTGGNTADVLDRVTETIRERSELRRLVRTLTAQGRLSRWVVSALPVFLLLAITLLNPKYMHLMYASGLGKIALMVAGLMVISGSLVIKRIVDIKV